ncbi:VWA domain-containing protein [Solwaraspora sp. WMMD792]|uniref:vWA domain-containing protein n=1 Tax=Solwaraspora sp. WMMD792 TaxID=3016099 RepID=UPI0024169213|nr:VWA domain-containing protein [Solwaraspora sp. WMMD792]MDG4773546.1 VWA domain-containing protein [Solwaraspora sp. WMMD792]
MRRSDNSLLPFYLVVDVSVSMAADGKLEAVNEIVPALVDALALHPVVAARVRFGLIDFSDHAEVRLPLGDLLAPGLVAPALAVRGGTCYESAFTTTRDEIESDMARFAASGESTHRPTVWFISDGRPTDLRSAWRAAFAELTSSGARPSVVACGVDEADPRIIRSLAHPATGSGRMASYLMVPGSDPARTITGIAQVLVASVVRSGYRPASDAGPVLPDGPDLPPGVQRFDPTGAG